MSCFCLQRHIRLERETRFELATPTLARLCSTTELFPPVETQKLRRQTEWRPIGGSNPCYRRERAVSWTTRRMGRTGAGNEIRSDWRTSSRPCRITFSYWSGKRDSNSRPQPWQGCALPLSYSRTGCHEPVLTTSVLLLACHTIMLCMASHRGFEPLLPP